MTPDHMSFRFHLTPDQASRSRALIEEWLQRLPLQDGPSREEVAALGEVCARLFSSALAHQVMGWPALKQMFADMRQNIANVTPPPKRQRLCEGLTIHEVIVIRALLKYPKGISLNTIEQDSQIERNSLARGVKSAQKYGLMVREPKGNTYLYKLTAAGREAYEAYLLAKRAQRPQGVGAALANPMVARSSRFRSRSTKRHTPRCEDR